MSPLQKRLHRIKRKATYRKWHRRIGFSVSLFLFNLAITGLLLNHFEIFSLHKHYVQSPWLLDWYGVKQPKEIVCIKYDKSKLCQVGSQTLLANDNEQLKLINNDSGRLISLTKNGAEIYIVTENNVEIYNQNFELIDSLDLIEELAATVMATTYSERGLILKTIEQIYLLDFASLAFEEIAEVDFSTLHSQIALPFEIQESTLKESLGQAYRKQQITYLKIVEDLHSGQILALQGKLLTDLVGSLILVLAISGAVTWQRKKKPPVQYKAQLNYQINSMSYDYGATQVCILNSQVVELAAASTKKQGLRET